MADGEDHRTIERLCDETLPALIGRLDASSLGELEVRKGAWRVRLRRTASPPSAPRAVRWGRRSTDVAPGAHGAPAPAEVAPATPAPATAAPAAAAQAPAGRGDVAVTAVVSTNGSGPHSAQSLTPVGPGRERHAPRELGRRTATSPAVGYYVPLDEVTPGRRVRAGDVIGHVDVLGVRVDVASPADGVVGRVLAQSGEAVEYGQELLRIDLASPGEAAHEGADDPVPTEG